MSKLIKLYTLNKCSFLYINYTSVKLFKSICSGWEWLGPLIPLMFSHWLGPPSKGATLGGGPHSSELDRESFPEGGSEPCISVSATTLNGKSYSSIFFFLTR